MACNLVHAEPLIEPMLEYCWFEPRVQPSVKSQAKFPTFSFPNAFEYVVCEIADIFSRPQCVLMTTQVLKDTKAVIHK